MAPEPRADGDQQDSVQPHDPPVDTAAAEAALKAKLNKKRTKSGCLTCRRRRIKCGEQRPVCDNCVKSKRHCEGYNQRVVFKPPTFDFRPVANGAAHITFQARPLPGSTTAYPSGLPHSASGTQFQPRSAERAAAASANTRPQPVSLPFQQQSLHPPRIAPIAQAAHDRPPAQSKPVLRSNVAYQDPLGSAFSQTHVYEYDGMHSWNSASTSPMVTQSQGMYPVVMTGHAIPVAWEQQAGLAKQDHWWSNAGFPATPQKTSLISHKASGPIPVGDLDQAHAHGQQPHVWTPGGYVSPPDLSYPFTYQAPCVTTATTCANSQPPASIPSQPPAVEYPTPDVYDHEPHVSPTYNPTYVLNEAAVEVLDDDYYDVQSDEETDLGIPAVAMTNVERQQTLSTILDMNQISVQDLQTRRYDTFLHNGMLDRYRVERVANPLKSPATARVFAHFISVTGPSLSVFERHPRNTSVLFTEGQIPFSQQGLWTYTMPMAALHHQGLLHAMLALASLHIARLTGASVTPSMQHYAWALKRIHHCVGHPKKRLKVTTIAASMLLGFYEILTADHIKWNMHLAGSKQLYVETDFVGMVRQCERMKMERAARDPMGSREDSPGSQPGVQDEILNLTSAVDERVVSLFVGREVRYRDHGPAETPPSTPPPALDLNNFETLKDLYWWYCKQDTYQSIVSGNGLLRWAECPPRAPLGRPDAVYGSFDHLILLLARIADFAARDRHRKLRQMKANGGQWKPPKGMDAPRPPPGGPPRPPEPANGVGPTGDGRPSHSQTPDVPPADVGNGPAFYGMAPPPRAHAHVPSSYGVPKSASPPSHAAPQEPVDLQTATKLALEEHRRIRAALETFSTSLGEAFEPLSSEYQPTTDTPFGPALFFRSYDIGCLWAVYNMAVLIAIRSHPHMPPAAHAAAGVAARDTAPFATAIGRIAAGIVPGPAEQPLIPGLGAALCESCLPVFFAAVQFQSPAQRHATVRRVATIARRTGWGSAELIAHGIETAWVKAAAAGRGPPYRRSLPRGPRQGPDPRLNGAWEERVDPRTAPPDDRDDRADDAADRRFVHVRADARLNWAIGVVGTFDDLAPLSD